MINSMEEINRMKRFDTHYEQMEYLLDQAGRLLDLRKYDRAAFIAWHILSEVDKDSVQAKQILKETYKKIFVNAEK